MVNKVHNMPKHNSGKEDKYINKHYALWSAEGQKDLKEMLVIAINNRLLQIKK